MYHLILFSFISFGIFWFLNYSELTEWLRYYLKYDGDDKPHDGKFPHVQKKWIYKLITCAFCTSYHCAYLLYLLHGYGFMSFVYAFGVAALANLISYIDKILLRKTITNTCEVK